MAEQSNLLNANKNNTEVAVQPKKQNKIPYTIIRRVLKENGIERTTEDTIKEIESMIEDVLRDLSNNMLVYTKHRKAKTTTIDDFRLAVR